jgi:pullulanase/glycogen debranching enzyme
LADVASDIATRAKVQAAVVDSQLTAEATHELKAGGSAFVNTGAPLKTMPPMPPTPAETNLIMRSLITTLFMSDGIPLINAGDEYGHSRRGGDCAPNTWKSEFNGFRWDAVQTGTAGHAIHTFVGAMSAFRKRRADLFSSGGTNVYWTTIDGYSSPKWNDPHSPHVLMCRRKASSWQVQSVNAGEVASLPTQDVVTIFNGTSDLQSADVGHPPAGFAWVRVVDTSLVFPSDCTLSYVVLSGSRGTYLVSPHAVVVLELAPAPEGYTIPAENV